MRKFIHKTPFGLIIALIAISSSLIAMLLVPIIMNSPDESFFQITLLVVLPTLLISSLVSSPVVYFYRKIINENYNMIKALQKDHLTGLLNRHTFIERYRLMLNESQVANNPVSLIMIDIDNFKKINDNYGHHAGDAVIIAVANLLKNKTRSSDLLCRFGGEEFLLVFNDMTYEMSLKFGLELLEATRSSILYHDQTISFTVSIGLAYFDSCDLDTDQYIIIADHTMYKAKSLGKNRLVSNNCGKDDLQTYL